MADPSHQMNASEVTVNCELNDEVIERHDVKNDGIINFDHEVGKDYAGKGAG